MANEHEIKPVLDTVVDINQVSTMLNALNAHRDPLWKRFKQTATDFKSFDSPGKVFSEEELDYKHTILEKTAGILKNYSFDSPLNAEKAEELKKELYKAEKGLVDYRSWDKTIGTSPETVAISL